MYITKFKMNPFEIANKYFQVISSPFGKEMEILTRNKILK